jgi:hypothetical protein
MNEENSFQTSARKKARTGRKWLYPVVVAMLVVSIAGGSLLGSLSAVNAAPTEAAPRSSTISIHQAHHAATAAQSVAPSPAPVNPEQTAPAVGTEPTETCQHQDAALQQACQEGLNKMDPAQREKMLQAMGTLDCSKMEAMMKGMDSDAMTQMMKAMDSTEMQAMMKNLGPADLEKMINDCGNASSMKTTSATWMGHMDTDEMQSMMGG